MVAAASMLAALFAAATPTAAPVPPGEQQVTVTATTRPNLFGTVVLPAGGGLWAEKWQKISTDPQLPRALMDIVRPAQGLTRIQQLAVVQAEVDQRIGWRSDGTAYGERDYWATAAETLHQGHGDDEDRAILKYQALRALGWKPQEFYLVYGKDAVRGNYTLLAARANGRFWLLEDRGDQIVAADRRTGFAPMVSFGDGRAWIHGKLRRPVATAAVTAIAATASGARE